MTERFKLLLLVAVILTLGVVIWQITTHNPKFVIGLSLSPGIVSPQVAIGLDRATLLAPDGSLWMWGYTGTMFRKGTNTDAPFQIGSETDWRQIAIGGWNNIFALKSNDVCGLGEVMKANLMAYPIRCSVLRNLPSQSR